MDWRVQKKNRSTHLSENYILSKYVNILYIYKGLFGIYDIRECGDNIYVYYDMQILYTYIFSSYENTT